MRRRLEMSGTWVPFVDKVRTVCYNKSGKLIGLSEFEEVKV